VIHTPYDGSAKPFTIGLRQLDVREWIDVDEHFDRYIAEKRRLYHLETDHVLAAETGTEDAQAEVLVMLQEHLRKYDLKPFSTDACEKSIRSSEPLSWPLAQAGLLVQEDLVVMRKSTQGWRLVAASLCFPSAWNLREKFGKPLHEVHGPVPGFNEGTRNASMIERMFDNLPPERPVLRWNWSLYGEDTLYSPATEHGLKKRFGDGDIAGRVHLRLERQTLTKLQSSGDILFTIRIYIDPLEVLRNHIDGAELALAIDAQLQGMSDAEINYKGLAHERQRLSKRLMNIANVG
jgi:dimethylamine monooxygenase subunit A